VSSRAALLLPSVAALLLAACAERAPSTGEGGTTRRTDSAAADTAHRTVADTLPAGRYQLRFHTRGVPDLFISLPAHYTIRDRGREGWDDLIMTAVDDPSLHSSTALSPGYLRLRTTRPEEIAQLMLPLATPDSADIIIAGRPVRWMRGGEVNGAEVFHYARIESSDFFSALSPELAKSAPLLVVEVAGADSLRVAALISAVESIRFVP